METPLVALHLLFRVAHMGGKIRHKLPGFIMRSKSLLRFGSEWSAGPARFLRANYNDCELLCLDTHIGMSHPSACKEGKLPSTLPQRSWTVSGERWLGYDKFLMSLAADLPLRSWISMPAIFPFTLGDKAVGGPERSTALDLPPALPCHKASCNLTSLTKRSVGS